MAEEESKTDKGKTVTIRLPGIPKINPWVVTTVVLLVVTLLLIVQPQILGRVTTVGQTTAVGELSAKQAADKAIDYINNNLIQDGEATFVSAEEFTADMYKVVTKYQGNDIDVYITKDGKWLFVSGPMDTTEELTTVTTTTQPQKTCEDITKADDAELDVFVVSYCPFGLQMQRIMAEIIKDIPSLADNIKIRYMGDVVDGKVTAMHGEQEATENLRQICIREEQPDKYWDYVSCFMEEQDATDSCLTEAGVDEGILDACMEDNGKGVEYAQEDFDLQDQHGVTGSPTLIMNGERVSEFDFGGRTAEAVKTLLCCGFNVQPGDCSEALSTSQAATSFAESYSSSSGSASGSC